MLYDKRAIERLDAMRVVIDNAPPTLEFITQVAAPLDSGVRNIAAAIYLFGVLICKEQRLIPQIGNIKIVHPVIAAGIDPGHVKPEHRLFFSIRFGVLGLAARKRQQPLKIGV